MLTETEIDALEGEALNRAVAEYVMGELEPPLHGYNHIDLLAPFYSPKSCWYCLPEYDKGDVCEWEARPFSADISLAWKVVEHMRSEKKWQWIADWEFDDPPYVSFFTERDSYGDINHCGSEGTTIQLAICRAALKATMNGLRKSN